MSTSCTLRWDPDQGNSVNARAREDGIIAALDKRVLLNVATTSFFGERLLQLEPNLFDKFFDFDDNSWKLTYHLPRIFATEMYAAKQEATDVLLKYFMLPLEERQGAAWLISTLESEMRNLGIDEHDIASFIMMTYWVINGNAYKLCFWILAHLLHDSSLLKEIRDEITPAVQKGTTELELRLERCPRLESVYNEVLRLTASSSSVRNVDATTELGGKLLRSGTKVLIPYRQLHFNRQVWGDDAADFEACRFLRNKALARSPCYRPFGGGTTYCPGRYLAKREVLTFVALVIAVLRFPWRRSVRGMFLSKIPPG